MRGTLNWSLRLASWLAPCLIAGCSGDDAERKYAENMDPSAEGDGGSGGAPNGNTNATGVGNGGTTSGRDAGPKNPLDACGDGKDSLVTGLRIQQVALYQTIKIPLYEAGAPVATRIADVVQGKSGLMRVLYEVLPGWTKHAVRGVLTVDNGGMPKMITADLSPSATSVENQLNTTFNFDVPGADIGPTTKFSVTLVETTCPKTLGNPTDVRVPSTGLLDLTAQRVGKLRVVLVPINLPAGQATIPSAAQLEAMRNAMLAHYPIPDIEITMHAAINSTQDLNAPNGSGWPTVLNQLSRVRSEEASTVTKDVYYYGLVTPAATLEAYCGYGGCTLGIANLVRDDVLNSPWVAGQMAGMGGGWANKASYDTMVHELGHVHGLPHAPCVPPGGRISDADSSFPDKTGATGIWGYDFRDKTLRPPTDKDIMGYCPSTWISDYYYKKLMARSKALNQAASLRAVRDERTWESVILGPSYVQWGASLHGMDGRANQTAQALDAAGHEVAEVEVMRVELSDGVSSFIYFPQHDPSWHALRLSDRTIKFADIAGTPAP